MSFLSRLPGLLVGQARATGPCQFSAFLQPEPRGDDLSCPSQQEYPAASRARGSPPSLLGDAVLHCPSDGHDVKAGSRHGCLGGVPPLPLVTLSCSTWSSGSQGTGQLEWKASTDVRARVRLRGMSRRGGSWPHGQNGSECRVDSRGPGAWDVEEHPHPETGAQPHPHTAEDLPGLGR